MPVPRKAEMADFLAGCAFAILTKHNGEFRVPCHLLREKRIELSAQFVEEENIASGEKTLVLVLQTKEAPRAEPPLRPILDLPR